MNVEISYSRNLEPVIYQGEECYISHHSDTAANIYIPSRDGHEWVSWQFLATT